MFLVLFLHIGRLIQFHHQRAIRVFRQHIGAAIQLGEQSEDILDIAPTGLVLEREGGLHVLGGERVDVEE
jgi:hypothetical protein